MRRFFARKASGLLVDLRLDGIIDAINSRAGGCILSYHHVSSVTLEEHLERLSRRYTFISLDEFVSRHQKDRSTSGLMVITFDDGFSRDVEEGAAVAIKRGWPMTFYLPTGFIRSRQPPWFEEIGYLVRAAPEGQHTVNGLFFYLDDERSRARARNRAVRHLFCRPAAEIEAFMDRLRGALFRSVGGLPEFDVPEPISARRVGELSRREELSFQAHSVSHPFFCTLSKEEIHREMETSRNEVEAMTGRPVWHFCYPYGTQRAIGCQAPEIARTLFRSATTILPGRCHQDADLSMLPRITLFEHYTAAIVGVKVATTP